MATAQQVQNWLEELTVADEGGEFVAHRMREQLEFANATTFDAAMLMTSDKGLVMEFEDGSEFQVTIVQSRQADQ